MDPINLIVGLNLLISVSANISGAKRGMKTKVTGALERPKTYLQKMPPNVAAVVFILLTLAIFKIGTLGEEFEKQYFTVRIIGMVVFLIFSWLQVLSFKSLGKSYSQDIVVFKNQKLCTSGLYKFIRHPQYLSQILSDLGAGIALLGYVALPIIVLVEIPLFILRASAEDRLLANRFGDEFKKYKKHSGFMLPFIG